MGLSMGGLVSRYALAEMTKANVNTQTRLLITHDSPHRGANVPLGLQYLIHMAGNVELFGLDARDVYPQYDEAINLLGEAATQQMLLYRANSSNSFVNNSFLDGEYRNMITFGATGPQPTYRFIATSLGSECGHPLFQPYSQLLNVDADVFLFYFPLLSYKLRTIVEAYGLPNNGSTNKIARLKLKSKFKLFGLITISKDVYDNTAYAPGSQLPIDGSPGATNPFTVDFNIPTINTGFPLVGIFGIIGYISVHVNGTPTNFTFVPAVSALDVTPFNTTSFSVQFVNGTNQNFPSTSETFIAQETNANAGTTNNAHIRFTARNARWLFNEMESIANTENCSAECSNPYYIKGNDIVCSSYIFTIPGYPRGSFVSWSVSPSNIASIQANGSTAILTQTGNGTVTITASIGACGQNGPLTKNIQVGPPATPSLSYNYDAQCGTFAEAYSTTPTGATGHVWNLNYGQIIQDIDGYGSNYFYYAPLVNNPQ